MKSPRPSRAGCADGRGPSEWSGRQSGGNGLAGELTRLKHVVDLAEGVRTGRVRRVGTGQRKLPARGAEGPLSLVAERGHAQEVGVPPAAVGRVAVLAEERTLQEERVDGRLGLGDDAAGGQIPGFLTGVGASLDRDGDAGDADDPDDIGHQAEAQGTRVHDAVTENEHSQNSSLPISEGALL